MTAANSPICFGYRDLSAFELLSVLSTEALSRRRNWLPRTVISRHHCDDSFGSASNAENDRGQCDRRVLTDARNVRPTAFQRELPLVPWFSVSPQSSTNRASRPSDRIAAGSCLLERCRMKTRLSIGLRRWWPFQPFREKK